MVATKPAKYTRFILLIAGLLFMLSCKDKDLPTPPGATTELNVINTTADTIKYYINGTRQNNTSPIFVGGSTGYLSVLAGEQTYKFSKSNRGFPVLFTTTFNLDTLTNYSIFVCGETADKAFKTIDPLVSADTLLASDKTFKSSVIRFVNGSPDAGSINVTVGVGDTVNINNAPFAYVGNYTLFTAGVKHVKVYVAGSSTPKVDSIMTFFTGNIYTLFTKGLLNGKGNAQFSVSLISAEN